VTLGLCSQIDLDAEVKKAAARLERERKQAGLAEPPKAGTLLPAEESTAAPPEPEPAPEPEQPMATTLAKEARTAMASPDEEEETPDIDSVFAKLKELKRSGPPIVPRKTLSCAGVRRVRPARGPALDIDPPRRPRLCTSIDGWGAS
jgi:hypothetical protein